MTLNTSSIYQQQFKKGAGLISSPKAVEHSFQTLQTKLLQKDNIKRGKSTINKNGIGSGATQSKQTSLMSTQKSLSNKDDGKKGYDASVGRAKSTMGNSSYVTA